MASTPSSKLVNKPHGQGLDRVPEDGSPLDSRRSENNFAHALYDQLQASRFKLNAYALLDGAQLDGLPKKLQSATETGTEARCLYSGRIDDERAAVAPYLVELEYSHIVTKDAEGYDDETIYSPKPLTDWVLKLKPKQHWGFILLTSDDYGTTLRHLRKFLFVDKPDKATGQSKTIFFRYYDPRVLDTYLRVAEPQERRAFVGNIRHLIYGTEDEPLIQQPIERDDSPRKAWRMTATAFAGFDDEAKQKNVRKMAKIIFEKFNDYLGERQLVDVHKAVHENLARFNGYGFQRYEHLLRTASWETLYGANFEQRSTGAMAIINSDAPETTRFAQLTDALETNPPEVKDWHWVHPPENPEDHLPKPPPEPDKDQRDSIDKILDGEI